jgi:DNA polymerase-3 subunit epsilon
MPFASFYSDHLALRKMGGMLDLLKKKQKPPKPHPSAPLDIKAPIREVRYAVIDTELTGLNEKIDSIVSIGALHIFKARIELGYTFYRLVKPRTAMGTEGILIHEITPAEVEEEPEIDLLLKDFLSFCENCVLVGHCITIDLSFLNKEVNRILKSSIANPVLDTADLYRWLWGRWSSDPHFSLAPGFADLYQMARQFGIEAEGAHNAVQDALITAQLFQRFIPWIEKSGIQNLEELLQIGDPYKGGETFRSPQQLTNL